MGALECESCGQAVPVDGRALRFLPELPEQTQGRVETATSARRRGFGGGDRQFLVRHKLRDQTHAAIANWTGTVLDVGCGTKPYRVAAPGVARWVGVDIYPGPQVDVLATADRLPFRDGVFEHILCSQVLEHVEEPSEVVAELVRVLAPGGQLVVSVPQWWPLHEAPRDFFRFTRFGLQYLASKHGLRSITVEPCGGSVLALVQVLILSFPPAGFLGPRLERRVAQMMCWVDRRLSRGAGNTMGHMLTAYKPTDDAMTPGTRPSGALAGIADTPDTNRACRNGVGDER